MRRGITFLLLLFASTGIMAQENYITTTTYLDSTGDASRALRSVVWFDGMGRERLRSLTAGGLNFHDNTARLHDPVLCAFTSPDPQALKYPQFNPYSHCGANFANLVDPSGENPVYIHYGKYIGNTSEGFTGEIYIYTGEHEITNLNTLSLNDLIAQHDNDVISYSMFKQHKYNSLNKGAIPKILTHLISHFEGKKVYDEEFHMSTISGGIIRLDTSRHNSTSWYTNLKDNSIYSTNGHDYESTVENFVCSIIYHEWYSHLKKRTTNTLKSHRLAYKAVINSPYFGKTTNRYKKRVLEDLFEYTKAETGRIIVDPEYRRLYRKYVNSTNR